MKKLTFDRRALARVFKGLKRYRLALAASLLLAAAVVALTLYVPLLTGQAIDCIIGKDNVNWSGVIKICITIGVCTLISALFQWLMNVINNRITYGMVKRLRREAFEKLQRLPLSYIDSHPTGDVLSRMITDVDQFTDGLLLGFAQFFTGILTILGTLVIMLTLRWQIALVVEEKKVARKAHLPRRVFTSSNSSCNSSSRPNASTTLWLPTYSSMRAVCSARVVDCRRNIE